jgi:predicted nuclease of predicted toxin-antitoxin system
MMAWAREQGFTVLTHDHDFGALLALTQADGPSAIQVCTQDVTPGAIGQRSPVPCANFDLSLRKAH